MQVQLQKLDETLAGLDKQQEDLLKLSGDLNWSYYFTRIAAEKQVAWFLHNHWSWKIMCISEDLNRNMFKNLLSTISYWSTSMSEKVKKPYFEPPETILHTLENVSQSFMVSNKLLHNLLIIIYIPL